MDTRSATFLLPKHTPFGFRFTLTLNFFQAFLSGFGAELRTHLDQQLGLMFEASSAAALASSALVFASYLSPAVLPAVNVAGEEAFCTGILTKEFTV